MNISSIAHQHSSIRIIITHAVRQAWSIDNGSSSYCASTFFAIFNCIDRSVSQVNNCSHMATDTTSSALDKGFLKALLAEDEVGCVIRSHLYVEAQVDRYLSLAIVQPEYLDKLDLNYSRKIDLLCCLGFDTEFRAPLKRLGKLRNDFAHDLSSSLSQQAVSELYSALPEFGKQAVHKAVDLLHHELGLAKPVPEFKSIPVGLQFVIIALNLERVCYAASTMFLDTKNGNG